MTFIGIDQTGAITPNGRPKPLPGCVLEGNNLTLYYFNQFSSELKSFDPQLICIDCVIGLSRTVQFSLREALFHAAKFDGYGRKVAQDFFAYLAQKKKHNRILESNLGINSVFNIHPFQKNIQTGTFRFWKEMGLDSEWYYFPAIPNEKSKHKGRIPVVEGFPTYYWKKLLHQPSRKPAFIVEILKKFYPELKISPQDKKLLLKDVNLADALILSLAAKVYQNDISRKSSVEGWLLGIK